MSRTQLHRKLTLERCRMHVAQLCAATYMQDDEAIASEIEIDIVGSLLRGLNQDLEILEKLLSENTE